jgi:hypothetical protein
MQASDLLAKHLCMKESKQCAWLLLATSREEDVAGAVAAVACFSEQRADVLLLCGDLTDYGLEEEAVILARELNAVVRFLWRCWETTTSSRAAGRGLPDLTEAGSRCSTGAFEVQGAGIAGRKASRVGSDARPWVPGVSLRPNASCGSDRRSMKPRRAGSLAHGAAGRAAALPHLSVRRSKQPLEIMSYPGPAVSRADQSLPGRCRVPRPCAPWRARGRTTGIPVYNVAMPLLLQQFPDRPPFRVVELAAPLTRRPRNG